MTSVQQMLERLAGSRDRTQLTMRWKAFLRKNQQNDEIRQTLMEVRDITNVWSNGRRAKIKRWR